MFPPADGKTRCGVSQDVRRNSNTILMVRRQCRCFQKNAFASPISRTTRQKQPCQNSSACRIQPAIFSVATNDKRKLGDFMSVAAGASDDAVKAERTI